MKKINSYINKKNKKGIVLGTLVVLIIFLIGFVIMLFWFSKSIPIFNTMTYDSSCALSLLNYKVVGDSKAKHLDCDRNNIILNNDKLNSIKLPSTLKDTATSKIEDIYSFGINEHDKTVFYSRIYDIIGDESLKCWKKFSDGRVDYFTDYTNIFKGNNYCIVCSVIDIDKDVSDKMNDFAHGIPKTEETMFKAMNELTNDEGNSYYSELEEKNVFFHKDYFEIAPFSLKDPIYIMFMQHKENSIVNFGGKANQIQFGIMNAISNLMLSSDTSADFENAVKAIVCDDLASGDPKKREFCEKAKKCLLRDENECRALVEITNNNDLKDFYDNKFLTAVNQLFIDESSVSDSVKLESHLIRLREIMSDNGGLYYSSIVVTNYNNVPSYCNHIFN